MPSTQHQHTFQKPIEVGQVWSPASPSRHSRRLRVVCRYPFAGAGDGPLWIVEHLSTAHSFERMPESTLRALFRLSTSKSS